MPSLLYIASSNISELIAVDIASKNIFAFSPKVSNPCAPRSHPINPSMPVRLCWISPIVLAVEITNNTFGFLNVMSPTELIAVDIASKNVFAFSPKVSKPCTPRSQPINPSTPVRLC